jgi:hypothetical protein
MSYILFYIIIIGIIIIIGTIIGLIGLALFMGMVSIGMIRITPLLQKIHGFIQALFPELDSKIRYNVKRTFQVKELEGPEKKDMSGKKMYLFHPHGAFSVSYFFHSCTDLTDWKKDYPFRSTISRYVFWLPFAEELCEKLGVVSNKYWSMKEVLEDSVEKSLHVIPGGTSEIPLTKPGKMVVKLSDRKGIFRLALETGTALVPVVTYGENELYTLLFPDLQKWLQKYFHIILPIPSWSSLQKWLSFFSEPLEHSIETFIGDSILVEKIHQPSNKDIDDIRKIYIEKLKELYRKTKPSYYENDLEVV